MNIEHLVVAENSSNSLQIDTYTTFIMCFSSIASFLQIVNIHEE